MKKLTTTQVTTLIITIVSMLFTTLIDNAGLIGIGAKGLMIIGFLKSTWDLYASFSTQDVADFANDNVNTNAIMKSKTANITEEDVKDWANR